MLRAVTLGPMASQVVQRPTGRMQDASDEELVALIGGGDRRAYHALVERHGRRVLGLARRMTRNLAEAEDISQDAFLRVWLKAGEWQPRGARFTTWLYRVVVNLCLDRRRKPSFAPIEAAGDPADTRPDAEATLATSERDGLVTAALGALPERQRAALLLSYYEGLNNADAAGVLELSVSALESLLVRARRALRQELQSRGVDSAAKEER